MRDVNRNQISLPCNEIIHRISNQIDVSGRLLIERREVYEVDRSVETQRYRLPSDPILDCVDQFLLRTKRTALNLKKQQ